jgi:WD40 repeat protein
MKRFITWRMAILGMIVVIYGIWLAMETQSDSPPKLVVESIPLPRERIDADNLSDIKLLLTLEDFRSGMALNENRSYLTVASWNRILVLNLETGEEILQFSKPRRMQGLNSYLFFDETAQSIGVAYRDDALYSSPLGGLEVHTISDGDLKFDSITGMSILSAAFSNNQLIGGAASRNQTSTIALYDAVDGHLIKEFVFMFRTGSISFHPTNHSLAVPVLHQVYVIDTENLTPHGLVDPLNHTFYYASFSPKGTYLLAGGGTSRVSVWNSSSEKLSCAPESTSRPTALTLSMDDTYLALGSYSGEIFLWDLNNCRLIHKFIGHDEFIYSVDFSSDNALLMSTSRDETTRIWDVATGQELYMLAAEQLILDAKFASDDHFIVLTDVRNTTLWGIP